LPCSTPDNHRVETRYQDSAAQERPPGSLDIRGFSRRGREEIRTHAERVEIGDTIAAEAANLARKRLGSEDDGTGHAAPGGV
jgi:hypothetical protein